MQLSFETKTSCTDYEQFAQAYLAEEFSELVVRRLPLRQRTLLESAALPDGRFRTRVRVVPELHLPEALARMVAGRVVFFDEIAVHDAATRSAEISIETPAGELVRAGGVASFAERAGELLLCFEGSVHVRVPGLGALLERLIVAEVKRGCDDVLQILKEYLEARDERGRVS